MGGLVSAPISAAATFLGGCCGTCVAASCCKLASAGTVSSEQGARNVLLWLQVFVATLAAIVSATPDRWLPWACDKLDHISLGTAGPCGCEGDSACWSDQLVYRVQASGVFVYMTLLILTISGCANGAARSNSVAKFMAVPVLGLVLLFVPNDVFSIFGAIATGASAIFLVVQAVLLIDFAYGWNEVWFGNATEARRVAPNSGRDKRWQVSILTASVVLFVASLAASIGLFAAYPDTAGRSINGVAMLLAIVLLVVSITERVEHGALLTSCVVMAYTVWLIYEVLAVLPSGDRPRLPTWAALTVSFVSLLSFSVGTRSGAQTDEASLAEAGAAPSSETASELSAAGEGMTWEDKKRFMVVCAVHITAGLYITASMAPKPGTTTFGLHAAAVFASLAMYGWSLAAPYVLTGRSFS